MSMWIKYAPLLYTNSTRLNGIKQRKLRGENKFSFKEKFFNILFYTRDLFASGFFVLTYLLINGSLDIGNTLLYLLIYVYLYIVFLIFYEIGYICNDVFSVKKEKKPTTYIEDSLDSNFWKINIIYRLILGGIFLFPIYFINQSIFYSFIAVLILMGITFTIHNLIRNYNINVFTRTLLRICKIMIFIIIVKYGLNLETSQAIVEAYLVFNSLDLLCFILIEYYRRFFGVSSDRISFFSREIVLLLSLIFRILLKNPYYLIISLRLYPRVIKNGIILFKKYGIKSNR